MQYLPHQQPGYPVHSHFTSQPGESASPRLPHPLGVPLSRADIPYVRAGFIPGAGIPLQKQLEHANQQSGFTDAVRLMCG